MSSNSDQLCSLGMNDICSDTGPDAGHKTWNFINFWVLAAQTSIVFEEKVKYVNISICIYSLKKSNYKNCWYIVIFIIARQ